jgi:hypothetical protein
MAKINNTSTFPIVAANDIANGDLLIGTDVSDTTNDAAGETKNFRVGDLRGAMTLITSASVTTSSAVVDITNFIDSSTYNSYFLYYDSARISGTGTSYSLILTGSNDGFSTTVTGITLGAGIAGTGNANPEQAHGFIQFGNLAMGSHIVSSRYTITRVSDKSYTGSDTDFLSINNGSTPITALRIYASLSEDIENLNYYIYGLRNT